MKKKVREYEGTGLRIRYDAARCIHAAECVRGLPQVFDPDARPWVKPEAATAGDVAGVIRRCPTGALSYERLDGAEGEPVPETNTVTVAADGPLYAHGDVEVKNSGGEVLLRDVRLALCRCGASENKPLCDGRHAKVGFTDPGRFENPVIKTQELEGSHLRVTALGDGPLILEGPLELHDAGDGQTCQGNRAALCRCGASANKPFCDGSHKTVGFRAP